MKQIIGAVLLLLPLSCFAQEANMDRYIADIFGQNSIMYQVSLCESGAQQHYDDGKVVVNPISKDYGLFQINKSWIPVAHSLGLDIDTTLGNLYMAKYILDTQGISAWDASKICWSKPIEGT